MYCKILISFVAFAFAFVLGGVSISVSAFTVITKPSIRSSTLSVLSSTTSSTTKPNAAKNFEEDLQLTLQIILDHVQRSTTTSKDQFVQQMEEYKNIEKKELEQPSSIAVVDISVPYDAAALLEYENSDKSLSFDTFKKIYELNCVASIIAKKTSIAATDADAAVAATATVAVPAPAPVPVAAVLVDISVPYDAAAMIAYESSDKSKSFNEFKIQYEIDTVASVIAKKKSTTPVPVAVAVAVAAVSVDISVPYDAAAMIAYENSDKSKSFTDFKIQYEIDSVASVIAKRSPSVVPAVVVAAVPTPVVASTSTSTESVSTTTTTTTIDVSVPYDAAALLAYDASDKSKSFFDFKLKYELQAVASVIAKKQKK